MQISNIKNEKYENSNCHNYINHPFSYNDINQIGNKKQLYSLNLFQDNIQNNCCCHFCNHSHINDEINNSENKFLYYITKLIDINRI